MGRYVGYIDAFAQANGEHGKQVLSSCERILHIANDCLQRVYYTHALHPSVVQLVAKEKMLACVTCIIYVLANHMPVVANPTSTISPATFGVG